MKQFFVRYHQVRTEFPPIIDHLSMFLQVYFHQTRCKLQYLLSHPLTINHCTNFHHDSKKYPHHFSNCLWIHQYIFPHLGMLLLLFHHVDFQPNLHHSIHLDYLAINIFLFHASYQVSNLPHKYIHHLLFSKSFFQNHLFYHF